MFGSKNSGEITFSYNADDVFNEACMQSAYLAKSMAGAEGTIDDIAITDDERELYDACLRQTMPNVYDAMAKLSSGVDGAFSDSVKVTEDETDGLSRKKGTYIELTIQDNGAYNENILKLVDDTLNECIKNGALAKYYATNVNIDLQSTVSAMYSANIEQLKKRLFQLKKKPVSSLF